MNILQLHEVMNMRIKKYAIFCCFWLLVLTIGVTCKTQDMQYVIYSDSSNEKTYEIKNEMLKRYAEIVQGVHEESAVQLVLQNLDTFEWREDLKADWQDNKLQLIIGDGQGSILHGDLESKGICFPEAKPKSLFAELFQ